ncbi:MAG: carbon monoxide dehydrogenase beta subunit family protein, partial [Candidatus Parvarchaeota archaeon]
MALSEPWQIAEVPGPRKALVITKPEVVAAMIKKAKSPILIVGHKAAEIDFEEGKLIDFLIEFSKKSG